MNKKQLSHLEKRLMEERARVMKELGYYDESFNATLQSSDGDLSSYSFHMADQGTDTMEREKQFLFASQEGRYLWHVNQALRRAGWLAVRDGPYGEMLETHESKAFAVVDHQLAHLYVKGVPLAEVKASVEKLDGVDRVVEPGEIELDHPRSGELIALAKPEAWFAYPYWLDESRAPDFARTVDIHRKPGYDPCELFLTSATKAAFRLLQKKLGFRYRMDVIPLDASLVRGSHGLRPAPEDGPLIVGENGPADMTGFKAYLRGLLA